MEPHPLIKFLQRTGPDDPWSFLPAPADKDPRLCFVKGCRHPRDGENRSCARCRKTRYRINNPLKYQFNNLRDSARKKKIQFSLTFEEFAAFAVESGYHENCGRFLGSLHVDRIDPLDGYRISNIRALESGENSRKGAGDDKREIWLARRRGRGDVVYIQPPLPDENYVGF